MSSLVTEHRFQLRLFNQRRPQFFSSLKGPQAAQHKGSRLSCHGRQAPLCPDPCQRGRAAGASPSLSSQHWTGSCPLPGSAFPSSSPRRNRAHRLNGPPHGGNSVSSFRESKTQTTTTTLSTAAGERTSPAALRGARRNPLFTLLSVGRLEAASLCYASRSRGMNEKKGGVSSLGNWKG